MLDLRAILTLAEADHGLTGDETNSPALTLLDRLDADQTVSLDPDLDVPAFVDDVDRWVRINSFRPSLADRKRRDYPHEFVHCRGLLVARVNDALRPALGATA